MYVYDIKNPLYHCKYAWFSLFLYGTNNRFHFVIYWIKGYIYLYL